MKFRLRGAQLPCRTGAAFLEAGDRQATPLLLPPSENLAEHRTLFQDRQKQLSQQLAQPGSA